MIKSLPLLAAAALLFAAGPRERMLCSGFLPENDLKIPVTTLDSGITEREFNRVIDRAEAAYRPIVAQKGGKLEVERNWKDGTVNAYASQSGSTWKVAMFGGLARHPAITYEGFALVICHELGHHIGGHPKMGWATNEGGADYFATLKCLRRTLPDAPSKVDQVAKQGCDAIYRDRAARARCAAGAMAGLSAASLFQELRGIPKLSFATPDPAQVAETDDSHPAPQCRLDTYYQGALCAKTLGEDVSNTDPTTGACARKNGFVSGLRPRCWYKPPADEPAALDLASRLDPKKIEAVRERLKTLEAAFGGA